MKRRSRWMVIAALIGCAALDGSANTVRNGVVSKHDATALARFVGDYSGQWRSELTDNVYDDISRYELKAPVMRLAIDDARRPSLTFFMDADAASANEPLDLLGFGCHSKVGPLLKFDATPTTGKSASPAVLHASFDFDWGKCPSRVYAVPSNDLNVEIRVDDDAREYVAHVTLLRSQRPDDKIIANTSEGKREVKIRPKAGDSRLYNPEQEYCVLNALGETEACFPRESEVKTYLVPFPFPGFTALWYTKKTPELSVQHGAPVRQYHEADFRRSMD
jgi:hypothetical protein